MKIERETNETRIAVDIAIGAGTANVTTSVPFLDHMMVTLARYSGLDMSICAEGDLQHHIVEDVAITVGTAFRSVRPDACGRFGQSLVAMDDAVVQAVVDAGGRPYYEGPIPGRLYDHWMRSFATSAGLTLHLLVLRGDDRHHMVEASFKALGLALRQALRAEDVVFSTKGAIVIRPG